MKTYKAILMSYNGTEDKDPSKGGFKSELDAEVYIKNQRCEICQMFPMDKMATCDWEWDVIEENINDLN